MNGNIWFHQLYSFQGPHKAIILAVGYAIHYFALKAWDNYWLHSSSLVEDLAVAVVVSRFLILEISSIAKGVLCAKPKDYSAISDFGESERVLYSLVGIYFKLVDEIVPSVLADPL